MKDYDRNRWNWN